MLLSVVPRRNRHQISPFPYEDVLPFLKEHVQPSDQMLVLGCGTELPLQLSRDGYGTRRGAMPVACLLLCQRGRMYCGCLWFLGAHAVKRLELARHTNCRLGPHVRRADNVRAADLP